MRTELPSAQTRPKRPASALATSSRIQVLGVTVTVFGFELACSVCVSCPVRGGKLLSVFTRAFEDFCGGPHLNPEGYHCCSNHCSTIPKVLPLTPPLTLPTACYLLPTATTTTTATAQPPPSYYYYYYYYYYSYCDCDCDDDDDNDNDCDDDYDDDYSCHHHHRLLLLLLLLPLLLLLLLLPLLLLLLLLPPPPRRARLLLSRFPSLGFRDEACRSVRVSEGHPS